MTHFARDINVDRALTAALYVGCVYEVIALSSSLPTITHLLKAMGRRHPLGKATLWLWCGFITWHFLEPDVVELTS